MKAVFVELPAFEHNRPRYMSDENFLDFQQELMLNPTAGEVIQGTGGLRKVRFQDSSRGKGKRGGLRVIYYWWLKGSEFLLFTVYDKGEMDDLTPGQRKKLAEMLKRFKAGRK